MGCWSEMTFVHFRTGLKPQGFYLNQQGVRFRACPVEPVDALVPGFDGGSPMEAIVSHQGTIEIIYVNHLSEWAIFIHCP